MDCVFCQIIAGTAPAADFRAAEAVVAFTPLNPVVDGHTLVVPKRHVRDAAEAPEVTAETMFYAAVIAQQYGESVNIITSVGAPATQTVFHLHLHIVPRFEGDGLALPWTGQHR